MKAHKELSKYYSDNKEVEASIVKEIGSGGKYVVTVLSRSGASSSAFLTEEEAEQYAEDVVS